MGKLNDKIASLKAFFKGWLTDVRTFCKQYNIPLLLIHLAMSAGLIIISESLYRRSIFKTLSWFLGHPVLMLMNFAVVLMIIATGHLLFRRAFITTSAVLVVGLLLSAINAGKYALRNVPLTPDDALLVKEVWALRSEIINRQVVIYMAVGVVFILFIMWCTYKAYSRISNAYAVQINMTLLVMCVLLLGIGQTMFNNTLSLEKTGFFYSLTNMTRGGKEIPETVQTQSYTQLYDDILAYDEKEVEPSNEAKIKPNVIIIMSEAFWDIHKMGVTFSENPVPYFENLRKESAYGELYVPVMGGGTVNTEFEVLTGMTLKNYSNDWYMVYPNEIKAPYPSLASIFRNQGYTSVGLHPYMSWYYNRYEAYKHFGFNTFKSLEFMGDTDKFGSFTKDQVTFDEILSLIKDTASPLFNYTVTMQNHGPYGDARFSNDERTLSLQTPMSDEATYLVNNYAQGLYYSDKALENFIEALREIEEPTMVIFFGDHLPMLGEDFLAYRESGYIGDEDASEVYENLDMMTVPFIAWRNDREEVQAYPVMNASFLTTKILEWADADIPNYLKAVEMISERMPIMTHGYAIDSEDNKVDVDNYAYQLSMAEYLEIKTQLLDVDGLLNTDKWLVYDNSVYNTGLQSMTISETRKSSDGTGIEGGAFVPEMTVLVNDESVSFNFVDSNEVTITQVLEHEDTVQVIVSDPKGDVVTASNIYKMP